MSEHAGYAGIVYWRRSLWNGARCVPVVLSLTPEELRAQDRDGQVVFRGDPRKVDGRLTRLGTLVVNVEGKRYALVGRGSDLSPAPTSGQHAAVSGYRPPSDVSAGAFDQIMNGGAMARMRGWHSWLGAAGARLR